MTALGNRRAGAAREHRIPGEEGIWVFVLGDMTVFALFFGTFMYSRGKNPEQFARDHLMLHTALGTVNTVLLLTSSLAIAVGVHQVLSGRHATARGLFVGGALCGLGFIGVKAIEWVQLFGAGISVGSGEYFSYYFMFTGIHLAHVVIGLTILGRMINLVWRPALVDKQVRFCETGGIFWHMVDLLWIVLFALFYLVR